MTSISVGLLDYSIVDRARPGTSGVSDMTWDLARGLIGFTDDIYIIGPYTTDNYPIAGVTVHSYKISDFWYRNILTQIMIIKKGSSVLRKTKAIEIIHVPEYLSAALLSYWISNIPIVLTTPGNIFERIDRYNPYDPLTTFVYKWAARQAAKRCSHIIATSRDMARWWEFSGAPPEKVTVIPLMVNISLFYPRKDARMKLGWGNEECHLLFVGRLAMENRIDLLLECLANLSQLTSEKIRLHIIGNGPEKGKLQEISQQAGIADNITWHGSVSLEQLPYYYSAAKLLVFSRPTGAPPRVIPQALACGTPVISVPSACVEDYVVEGVTGTVSKTTNAASLSYSIFEALSDVARLNMWGQVSVNYAIEHFAIEAVTRRIRFEVYEPLLNQKI